MDILSHIDNPKQLEKMYRDNKSEFKAAFDLVSSNIKDKQLFAYWHERLNYQSPSIFWGNRNDFIFILCGALLAGILVKIPAIFGLDPEMFYQRNIGFIVFPILTTYFIWTRSLPIYKTIGSAIVYLLAGIYINSLPVSEKSDTFILACIHLPILLWGILGFSYVRGEFKNASKLMDFLRYNGDLIIITGLILICGGMLTGITIGLFSVIGFQIEDFYFNYFGIFGLAAAPIVGTYLTQTNPQLVHKIAPVIARIFSPLVLIMLFVYLIAIAYSGKDPYNDRTFLIIYNALLIGVMAIILFSISESGKHQYGKLTGYILLALSMVTLIVNGIALSAILYRISEWGITPNRIAVLGANVLMLIHLALIAFQLSKQALLKTDKQRIEQSITYYLPVYIVWICIVTFLFPIIFQYK